ncbi:MAG: hypothetical protein LBV43_03500 [Prevotella sp.]|jgi:hypothetical protein|nr:hypothetical protein [Prevotella sp.]
MKSKCFISILFFISLFSCNQEEDYNESSPILVVEKNVKEFTYKGVKYSSEWTYSKDSTIIFDDNEVNNIYQQIQDMPNLAVLYDNEGAISYFDDDSEIKEMALRLSMEYDNNIITKSAPPVFVSYFVNLCTEYYTSPDFPGNVSGYGLYSPIIEAPTISKDFNDKTMSVHVKTDNKNYILSLYADANFKGRSMHRFFAPYTEQKVNLSQTTPMYYALSSFKMYNPEAIMNTTVPDYLMPGQKLTKGQYIASENKLYVLHMQEDGNLVLKKDWQAVWASNTTKNGECYASLQGDGNFVIYTASSHKAQWASNTRHISVKLLLQNDGNLILYTNETYPRALWSTGIH